MENMELYNAVREVPATAQKTIKGGRLKGMTDINPMWRISQLTEQFGPCGIGWKYSITDKSLVPGAHDTMAAFVDIELFVKIGETWSAAIPGTGGAMFVAKETGGLFTSDECYKMALTDALSVACKALGFGADIYWAGGRSKYEDDPEPPTAPEPPDPYISEATAERIMKGLSVVAGDKIADQRSLLNNICGLTDVYKIKAKDAQKVFDELVALAQQVTNHADNAS